MKNLSKNEEDVIEDAIVSAKSIAQEVIVVDANSSDGTEKILKKHAVTILKHPFVDFSDQRNFGIGHAHTPWVLYLDADERITRSFAEEIRPIIEGISQLGFNGFFVRRKTFYYGKDWHMEDRVQRLFKRDAFVSWKGVVHETPYIKGDFGEIKSPIEHYTHRNLSQMIKKTNEWSELEAKLRYSSKHPKMEQWRFFRVMISEFVNSYIKNKGYKNGTYGLIEAMYQSFSIFITYAKLWELQTKEK